MDEEMSGVVQQEEAAPATDLDNIATDDVQETPAEQEEVTQEQPAAEDAPEEQEPEQPQIPNDVWKAARLRAQEEAARRYDREVAKRCAGKANPITGKPITTMKEYWDALDAQAEVRRRAAIEQATKNVSSEQAAAIRKIIENDPEKARMKQQLDEINRQTIEWRAAEEMNKDIQELSKIDPSIKSADDLSRMEGFDQIVSLCQRGLSLVDAYKITHYDSAVSASERSGRQAAINAARSKNHLAKHGGNSSPGNMKAIPAKQLAFFKEQFPDKSMDELTKLYNQTI